jgi:hypothetical protein
MIQGHSKEPEQVDLEREGESNGVGAIAGMTTLDVSTAVSARQLLYDSELAHDARNLGRCHAAAEIISS